MESWEKNVFEYSFSNNGLIIFLKVITTSEKCSTGIMTAIVSTRNDLYFMRAAALSLAIFTLVISEEAFRLILSNCEFWLSSSPCMSFAMLRRLPIMELTLRLKATYLVLNIPSLFSKTLCYRLFFSVHNSNQSNFFVQKYFLSLPWTEPGWVEVCFTRSLSVYFRPFSSLYISLQQIND